MNGWIREAHDRCRVTFLRDARQGQSLIGVFQLIARLTSFQLSAPMSVPRLHALSVRPVLLGF
jgi:hypothetical protein